MVSIKKKKDHTGMAPSSYKSGKRCKCVKADLQLQWIVQGKKVWWFAKGDRKKKW